jgi:TonB family protein
MMNPTMDSTSSLRDNDEGIKRALLISIAFHLIAIGAFTLKAVFYPPDAIDLQDAIRVDIVALPDKQAALPPEPIPAPAPQAIATPPPKVAEPEPPAPKPEPIKEAAKPKPELPKPTETKKIDLTKSKQEQAAALKRLEALQRIQNMERNKPVEQPAPQPVRGNQVSSGDALRGLARMEHQAYLGTIKTAVKSHWNLPGWMTTANLSARVRLYVDANGNVIKKMISKSSGNEEYDARALGAVEAASPLPVPPESLTGVLAVDGIEVELVPD